MQSPFSLSLPRQQPQQQVILITGASSGIGKDMALRMIAEGHIVYGGARRVEQMQDIVQAGGHAIYLDVTDSLESIQTVIQEILKVHDRIDVLVNNAGIGCLGSIEDVDMETLRKIFEVNFFGMVQMTKAVLPSMRRQQQGGSQHQYQYRRPLIVNVSSVAGRVHRALHACYVASKHAVEGWSDCLRVEVQPFGIDVVVFQPGLVQTELLEQIPDVTPPDSPYVDFQQAYQAHYGTHIARAAPPSVVSDCLVEVVQNHNHNHNHNHSKRRKRRYAMGYMGKFLVTVRAYLGTAIIDWSIQRLLATRVKIIKQKSLSLE